MAYNTIILKKGESSLTKKEYQDFESGETIWGVDSDPEELGRWVIEDIEDAKKELVKYKCEHIQMGDSVTVREYALEYCETDEDGEFVSGSDYDLAQKEEKDEVKMFTVGKYYSPAISPSPNPFKCVKKTDCFVWFEDEELEKIHKCKIKTESMYTGNGNVETWEYANVLEYTVRANDD